MITVPNENIQTNFEIPKRPTTNQPISRKFPCRLYFGLQGIDVEQASEFVESVLNNFEKNCCGERVTNISFGIEMERETNNALRDAVLNISKKYFSHSSYVAGVISIIVV